MTTSVKALDAIKHTASGREKRDLVDFINSALGDTNINPNTDEIFEKITDGVILCRLVELIDPPALARQPTTRFVGVNQFFSKLENLKIALDGAKKIGCNIVNVDPQDLSSGTPTLVLGLLSQLVRILLMSNVMAVANQPDEAAEDSLLRWFNFHLKAANVTDTVTSFGSELQDCRLLSILLHQLEPSKCDAPDAIMNIYDDEQRAEALLKNAEKIDCARYVSAHDIVRGNAQRIIPFLATLFLKYPTISWEEVSGIKRRSGVFRSPSRFPNRNSLMLNSPISPRIAINVTPVKSTETREGPNNSTDNGNGREISEKTEVGKKVPVNAVEPEKLQVNGNTNKNINNPANNNRDNDNDSEDIESGSRVSPRTRLPPPSNSASMISLHGDATSNAPTPKMTPSNSASVISVHSEASSNASTPKMTPSNSANSLFYPGSHVDTIDSLKNEILLLRSERNTLQIELASVRSDAENSDREQKEENRKLKELIKKLQADKQELNQKIESLEMENLRKKRENELRAQETLKLENELETLRNGHSQLNGHSENGNDGENFGGKNNLADDEREELLLKIKELEENYTALENELNALNKENTELNRLREEDAEQLTEVTAALKKWKNKASDLEKLISSLQHEQSISRQGSKNDFNNNNNKFDDEDLKLENEELKKSVDECFKKIAELEEKEISLKKELAAAAESTRQKVKEQESHLLQLFEARERDYRVQKENLINDLQSKIRLLEGNGAKGPEVDRLLSTAKLKFDTKENELRQQFTKDMAQRDKLLREKAEKVKELKRELAKAKKKEKRMEQFLSPPDEHEGWLYKQANNNKTQRRWCVLRGETLFIYSDNKVKNWVKTAGALYIPNCVLKSVDESELKKKSGKYKYGFSIGSKFASRTYVFLTDAEDTRQEWIDWLERTKRYYESKAALLGDVSDTSSSGDSSSLPPPVVLYDNDKKSQKSSSKSSEKKSIQQPISSSSSSSEAPSRASRSSSTASSAKLQPEVIAEIMQMNSQAALNNNANDAVNSEDESLDEPVSRSDSSS